jgi:ribosomal-protein-alanine N-acetyltransferase
MPLPILTPHLLIREIQPGDEQGLFTMDADPEVHRYLSNRPDTDLTHTRTTIASILQQYTDNGICRWAITDRHTGDFIGWTGFNLMREQVNGHINYYDFGYRLARRYWGRGIATEAGHAALHYGIHELGLKDIYAMTDVANAASRRLLERLGFRLITIFGYDASLTWRSYHGEPTTWYQLMDAQ